MIDYEKVLESEGMGVNLPSLRGSVNPCTLETDSDIDGVTYRYFDAFCQLAHYFEECGYLETEPEVVICRMYGEGCNARTIQKASGYSKTKLNNFLMRTREELGLSTDSPLWAGARYKR